jgi:predicted peptidase
MVFSEPVVQDRYPCGIVAPQCPAGQRWVEIDWDRLDCKSPEQCSWPLAAAIDLVDTLIAERDRLDTGRLVITGLSMGGFGVWDALARWPDKFRAALAICGGGDPSSAPQKVRTRIWAFHAEDDPVVDVVHTRQMVRAFADASPEVRYTEYPAAEQVGHLSWNRAFCETEGVVEFLLGRQ